MGEIYTGFLFIKFNPCIFYSAERELGVWLLKSGRRGGCFFFFFFLHADFLRIVKRK